MKTKLKIGKRGRELARGRSCWMRRKGSRCFTGLGNGYKTMNVWFETKSIGLVHAKKFHSSDSMHIKPLLLAIPGREHAAIGWFIGGLIQEWRMEGSNSEQNPTHWMPMPKLPQP